MHHNAQNIREQIIYAIASCSNKSHMYSAATKQYMLLILNVNLISYTKNFRHHNKVHLVQQISIKQIHNFTH